MLIKFLFDKSIRQPFKQVFRELYVPTPEEIEATQSRRYAGNQIQPQKTVAVLKGRRWVADYEDGLQRSITKRTSSPPSMRWQTGSLLPTSKLRH